MTYIALAASIYVIFIALMIWLIGSSAVIIIASIAGIFYRRNKIRHKCGYCRKVWYDDDDVSCCPRCLSVEGEEKWK